jgi:hypothetical protein
VYMIWQPAVFLTAVLLLVSCRESIEPATATTAVAAPAPAPPADQGRDALIELAEQEYQRLERDMQAVARRIDPGLTWQQILERYQSTQRPRTVADVIPTYEAEIRRARAFMLAKNLVSFSFPTEVHVLATPADKIRSYPYAAYLWLDALYVTLDAGGGADEVLNTHGNGLITTAVVHEVYPGHRVQNLAHPGKQEDETFIEGWALYAEELMLRSGYYATGPPELELFAMRMLLYRTARALLDRKIQRRDLSPDDAVQFLQRHFNLSPERSRIEVFERYVKNPGSAATYFVGKRQIEQLRRQVEAAEGPRFNLKQFHDRLLSRGGASVPTIAREVFQIELGASAAPVTLAPQEVLARSRVLYGSLRSYADSGTVDVELGPAANLIRERHTFKTHYRGPRHFSFDFIKHQNLDRFVVWGNDEAFHSWWQATGVHSTFPKGKGATAFLTGALPTKNALMLISPLLFPNAGLAGTVTEFGDQTNAGTESVGGRPCHKLTGVARSRYGNGYEHNVRETTIWIDQETLLIRRIFEDTPRGTPGGTVSRVTTTFEPVLNPTLEDSRFTFVPPTPPK